MAILSRPRPPIGSVRGLVEAAALRSRAMPLFGRAPRPTATLTALVAAIVVLPATLATAIQPYGWPQEPIPDDVRRTYSGPIDDRTEVSVTFEAPAPAPDSDLQPTTFTIVATIDGREPRRLPDSVVLHATTDVRYFPLIQRYPRLTVTVDGDDELDLTTPEREWSASYPCADCTITGVSTTLSAAELDRLARAGRISGNALGVAFELPPDGIDKIGALVAAITPVP